MFLSLLFEGGLYLLPVLLIFYFAYHKPVIESAGIFIWCLILLIKAIMTAVSAKTGLYSTLTFESEWMNDLGLTIYLAVQRSTR